jgi:cell division protein FtsB
MKMQFKNPDIVIKELTRELVQQKEKNKELRSKNTELQQQINRLEEKVNCYEARL